LIFEAPGAADAILEGQEVEVDPDQGIIRNLSTGEVFKVAAIPPFMKELLDDGGLIAHIKKRADLTENASK
jgi:3-isopropylmalate/(R)-2-methylmalate dehydratase small subunit